MAAAMKTTECCSRRPPGQSRARGRSGAAGDDWSLAYEFQLESCVACDRNVSRFGFVPLLAEGDLGGTGIQPWDGVEAGLIGRGIRPIRARDIGAFDELPPGRRHLEDN